MRPSAAELPHPPLDFPLVGLGFGACERRWVEFFEGELGRPVWSVWLDHLVGDRLLVVRAAPRARWDDIMGSGSEPSERAASGIAEFVATAVRAVLDQARPELDRHDERTYNSRIYSMADSIARQWAEWDMATWQLDGRDCDARILRLSNIWTGVTAAGEDLYIGVTGYNSTDPEVSLEQVDGHAYDFDFTAPFSIADLDARAAAFPNTEDARRAAQLQPSDIEILEQRSHRHSGGHDRPFD